MVSPSAIYNQPLLFVDDEESWLNTLSMAFRLQGFTNIVCCSHGACALELLQKNNFSMVVLDWNMPGCGGPEIMSMLLEAYPQTPVIVVSGLLQADTEEKVLQAGAMAYCCKTDDRLRLFSLVSEALATQLASKSPESDLTAESVED